MKKNVFRIICVAIIATCIITMSGCKALDISVKWDMPKVSPALSVIFGRSAAAQQQTEAQPTQAQAPQTDTTATADDTTATTVDTAQTTQTVDTAADTSSQDETSINDTTAPAAPNPALDTYNQAVANSSVQGVVLGSKFSNLTLDIGDKETFDGLGNAHDFSKEHEFDATEISLPTFPDGTPLTMEETDTSYIIKCDSADSFIETQIPVRQITGYVYFLDIAAVDGILSLIGSDKADSAIYSGIGDGSVSMKNGKFECTVDKATMKLTDAKVVYEETFDDIVSLSFPKEIKADLTMNITLGFSF